MKSLKVRRKTKQKLLGRIEDDSKINNKFNMYSLTSAKYGSQRKNFTRMIILNKEIDFPDEKNVQLFLESVFCVKKQNLNIEYLKIILNEIFNTFYPFKKKYY